MTKILVPLDGRSELWSRAAYFALQLAKRTGAKILFLTIGSDSGAAPRQTGSLGLPDEGYSRELDQLIAGCLASGLQIESYVTNGDFVSRVAEFARHHNVSRVVLALPEGQGAASARAAKRLDALQEQLSCALVTVRSRHEPAGTSEVPQ